MTPTRSKEQRATAGKKKKGIYGEMPPYRAFTKIEKCEAPPIKVNFLFFASQRNPIAFGTFAETNTTMASARQIRDEIMKMTIVVNSDPAQKAIYELSKKNQELKEKNDSLGASMKEVRSTLGKNSDEYKKLTSELNQNKLAVSSNEKEMERLRGEMDVTQMTMQQLRKEAALLRTNLNNMVPGSQASIEMQAQLDRVNNRMTEVRTGANQTSTSFRNLADRFNHYSGIITAGIAVFVGFGLSVQSVIDRNNKLVDAQTAVAKTVNMTKEEVDDLTKAFSTFDTRTSRIDLLKIAETGGRLGVGKAQIKDFVQEVDKANVALGDGFSGGVEAVTDTLGKLKNLYGETKDLDMATAINQIGSAMNELGANGAATEQNIGEFALRLGSLPAKLKPTIAESLALGAAFEESGINAERAGTAYATFIRNAATNGEKFAKVMNISKQEVEEMMNKDPLEFFLKFSEGMKGMDTTNLAKTMEYLKMNDQYVIASMGAASENTDRFRKSIELSNTSLSQATSLTTEFNKVNNNTAAIFEKVQKRFLGLFTSDTVANTLNFLISAFGKFIGAVEDSEGTVTSFRNGLVFLLKVISLLVVAMVSYNLVTGVYNTLMRTAYERVLGLTIVEKARNAVMVLGNGIMTLYRASLWLLAAGYSLVTGNVAGATFAMRGFTAAIMANPLGAFLGLITLVAGAYYAFSENASDATKKQKSFNEVMKEGSANAAQEITSLQLLYNAATNVKLSTEERMNAVKKLKEEFPGYFAQISDEIIMNGKASKSYHELRAAIVASARANAAKSELEKREIERLKGDAQWRSDYAKEIRTSTEIQKRGDITSRVDGGDGKSFTQVLKKDDLLKASEERLKIMREQRLNGKVADALADKIYVDAINTNNKLSSAYNGDTTGEASSNYTVPGDPEKKGPSTKTKSKANADRRHEKDMNDALRRGEQSAELARQIELDIADAKIEAMEEGYDKEIDQLDLQEQRKLAEIDKQKVSPAEFAILQKQIDKAKGKDKALFENLKLSWQNNNASLDELKLAQVEIFDNKRDALRAKSDQKWLNEQETNHQKELGHLKRQQNEELASYQTIADLKEGLKGRIDEKERQKITTWAEGKEALIKIYLKRELELQIAHLQSMVQLYEGLDLGILTPEQRESVLKFIDEAGNKIAEFKAKIAGEDQKDKGPKKLSQKGSNDVLGMSLDDWDTMFTNVQNGTDMLGTMVAAVGALQNAFGAYYKYVEANEKRQLQNYQFRTDAKKRGYKKQLQEGYINQETFKKLTIKADQDLEKKKAELAIKAAKREKAMQIASIIGNTANAIMGIWAQFPKFDFGATAAIMSGVVGALGLVQLGTVLRTPLPTAEGYEDGFNTEYPMERSQDGNKFNVRRRRLSSGLVDRPTHFIAGENNRVEMVIDNPTWTKYPAELKQAIYSANSRAKGFENGFNTTEKTSESSDEMMMMMMTTLNKMNGTLDNIQRYGIEAKIAKTARNGKDIDEMRNEFLDLNNKNKH
ncbi:phage tail tape measure protein [Chryseobacterium sp. MP_3.2]|uniref:phage tail tape measure protein n=1 Tax=Chryseobacterium sp. MP_3.2 TaxID=3071712 RepID=UPI002DF74F14|nr:TP901 family phage tail tape measure protein [Chryseobacterium sp. MP_3.2]